jgi:hypothetical protein
VGVGECGCVWFGLDQHHDDEPGRARTSQDEPGRALTAALQNTAVGLWCSCMCSAHALLVRARSCVSVYPSLNEYVPIYSICDAFQAPRISHLSALISHLAALISHLASLSSHLAPRSPHLAPRISQLSSRTSHLSALISHLALPQVACQIFRRRRRRGPMRGTQHRDCLCTTVVECPSPPPSTVWPCAVPARVLGWTCGRVGVWSCGRHRARRRYQVSCSTRWVPRCRPDGARRCLSGRV